MLKLGYKASAEQFAPSKLLAFSVLAEQVGFNSVFVSDHFQPWNHTDGHAPNALVWLGALGASTQRVVMGTSRADADLPLPPVDGGAGVRHARRDVPRPRGAGRRHRRGAERGAVHRHGLARDQGALRPPARGQPVDPQAVDRGTPELRGPVLPHRECDDLRQAGQAGADLRRRGRAAGGEVCRPVGAGLHLHVRQGLEALHRDAAAERRGRV